MMDLDRLRVDLTRDERVMSKPYDDATGQIIDSGSVVRGKASIGRGRNLSDRGLTEDEIEFLYNNDVTVAVTDLDRVAPWWRGLTEARQRAVCNMMFNLGASRFLGFRNFIAAMKAGDYEKAAAEALDSRWADQVGSRAHRIADLIRKG